MAGKTRPQDIRIRYVLAVLEMGEILYGVLSPEEKRALQENSPAIEKFRARRRYRWNGASRRQ